MVKPYLDRPSGKITADTNHFSGGLNTYYDKAFIEDNQMPYAINVSMFQPPVLSTRADRIEIDLLGNIAGDILALWAYNENEYIVILDTEDTGFSIGTGGASSSGIRSVYRITVYNDEYTRTKIGDIPASSYYSMTYVRQPAGEFLYIGTSNARAKVLLGDWTIGGDRYTLFDEDGVYGYLAWHKGRLFVADPLNNIITYSAYNEPDVFKPTSTAQITGDFFVTNGKGQIVGMRSFDNKLVIFCEHSMHLLYGDTPDQSMSTQFQLVDMDNDLGAVNDKCITTGGGNLFWLGDNFQVYKYTGSGIYMISRPTARGEGGIDNLLNKYQAKNATNMMMASTYDKLYFNVSLSGNATNEFLFVYDIYNHIWWAEDGNFNIIRSYEARINRLVMANTKHVYLSDYDWTGFDHILGESGYALEPIQYIFQTKIYGATSVSGTKSISEVWFQARAQADVYLNDVWQGVDMWKHPNEGWTIGPSTIIDDTKVEGFTKIGTLERKIQASSQVEYTTKDSEQQVMYVGKMFGQRVNAFSLVVKGEGLAEFSLLQRKWRINENI